MKVPVPKPAADLREAVLLEDQLLRAAGHRRHLHQLPLQPGAASQRLPGLRELPAEY